MDDAGDQLARAIAQQNNFSLYDRNGIMEERTRKAAKLAFHSLRVNKINESLITPTICYLTSQTARTIGLSDQGALYCAFRPLCATFLCNSVVVKNDAFSSRANMVVLFVGMPSAGKTPITSLMKRVFQRTVVLLKQNQVIKRAINVPALGDMEFKPSTLKGLYETLNGNAQNICGFADEFSSVFAEIAKDPSYLNQLTSITDGLPVSASVSVYDAKSDNRKNKAEADGEETVSSDIASYSNVNLVAGAQPAIVAEIIKRHPASGLANRLRVYYLQFTDRVPAEDGAKSFFEAYVVICLVLFEISKSSIGGTVLEYRLDPECRGYVREMEAEIAKMLTSDQYLKYSEFEHAEASKRLKSVPGSALVDHLVQIVLEVWGFFETETGDVEPPVGWSDLPGADDEHLIRQAEILVPRVLSHNRLLSISLSSLVCADEFRRKHRNDMSIIMGDQCREVVEAAEQAGVIPKHIPITRAIQSSESAAKFKKLKGVVLMPGQFLSQNVLSHRNTTRKSHAYPFDSLMSISTTPDMPPNLLRHFEQSGTKFAFKAPPPSPHALAAYTEFSAHLATLGVTINEYAAAYEKPSLMWKDPDVTSLRKFLASDWNIQKYTEGRLEMKDGSIVVPLPSLGETNEEVESTSGFVSPPSCLRTLCI